MNISIMRIFNKLRRFDMLEKDLINRMDHMEKDSIQVFKVVFEK